MLDFVKTPPMGWNSYDCFGWTATEEQICVNAKYIAENLAEYGWQYVVLDYVWAKNGTGTLFAPWQKYNEQGVPDFELRMDEYGRLMPATDRFPSCTEGLRPLADYVHSLGLKFGLHIMRGIPRQAVEKKCPILGTDVTADSIVGGTLCKWLDHMCGIDTSRRGAQEYINSIVDMYAEWGVDLLKIDDICTPYRQSEIEAYRHAIDRTGREIVLSLSPGDAPITCAEHVKKVANMWRIKNDVWDSWGHIRETYPLICAWQPHVSTGHYPDADMLPLGRVAMCGDGRTPIGGRDSELTHAEQQLMMTLWCFARSPLMIGGHLPASDSFAIGLFTNRDILDINQRGTLYRIEGEGRKGMPVWYAEVGSTRYYAVFDIAGSKLFRRVCIKAEADTAVDVWTGTRYTATNGVFTVRPDRHGVVLLKLL